MIKNNLNKQRITNPMIPTYQIPDVERCPPTPPKFLRDSMLVDDIEGAKPKKQISYETREFMDNKDIEGARAKQFRPRNTKYEYMDYSDLRKEEFHTKRMVNPLNPEYVLRDYAGNPISYGSIEGSVPKKLPARGSGELSMDLTTHDIIGAKAGTKGLGPFAERARKTIKESITTHDIEGAQASTVKKGALSKRTTNPLDPQYANPGDTGGLRQDYSYAEPWKEAPLRIKDNTNNPLYKKSTVIPIIEDKKPTLNSNLSASSNSLVSAANEALRDNMAKFYGMNPRDLKPSDIAKRREEAKRNREEAPTPRLDPRLQNDPDFQYDANRFFGHRPSEDSTLEWNKNINMFYKERMPEEAQQFVLREKAAPAPFRQSYDGSLYKRNAERFFGGRSEDERISSRGSVFQQNAAHFHGYETPAHGERPYVPPTPSDLQKYPERKPVLAQRQMDTMLRDPRYQSNVAKFFGAEASKAPKKPMTYEQRLEKFVGF